jgi:hypothetical protein
VTVVSVPDGQQRLRAWCAAVTGAALLTACGATSSARTPSVVAAGAPCVVRLHGKGGSGAATRTDPDGRRIVSPAGNDGGWGGRQWSYATDGTFAEAVAVVMRAVAAERCSAVVLHGFSNGGAFAAKLYCRAEQLGGRLRGVVVDDPVPDGGVRLCAPPDGVRVALYWTGALASTATPGWDCRAADWTCEGGTTIGVDAYAAALGTTPISSPHAEHRWNDAAPELVDWLR